MSWSRISLENAQRRSITRGRLTGSRRSLKSLGKCLSMKNPIESFRDHFNEVVEDVQRFAIFVRGKEFQEDAITTMERLLSECTQAKEAAIKRKSEEEANAYLAFEFMAKALAEELHFYLALKADSPD